MRRSAVIFAAAVALAACGRWEPAKPVESDAKPPLSQPPWPETRMPGEAATHITIPSGKTSAAFEQMLDADKDAEFVIALEEGTLLLAQAVAPERNPYLTVYRADTGEYLPDEHPGNITHWIEHLPETGSYLLVVHSTGKPTPFTLNLEVPQGLAFDKATSTAEVKIVAEPHEVVSYVVPPSRVIVVAELMSGPKDTYLTLSGLDDGRTLLGAEANSRLFRGEPPRTDDEIILRVHLGAEGGDATLRVQRK